MSLDLHPQQSETIITVLAPISDMASQGQRSVKAHYSSPDGTHEFTIPINAACADTPATAERTKYLSELRANTKTLQADVNKFLTEKMAEDKARDVKSSSKDKPQDELEEETYGEEQAQEDD